MTIGGGARLTRSAHVDTFCRDNLPPLASWPELLFDLPELRYPERLNCAAELLDAVIARHGADRRCLLTPQGDGGATPTCCAPSTRSPTCSPVSWASCPGNRVLLRGPNNPWLVACWLAVLKAGAVAVTTMPLLRAGELTTVARDRPGRSGPVRPAVRRRPARRRPGRRGHRQLRRAEDGDLTQRAAAAPAEFAAVPTPRPTTSRCSRSPRAPPGGPRPPCTSTATCWPSPTRSPGTWSGRPPTTCSPGRRRWPSRSGSAGCWCSRCGPARPRC